MANKEHFQLTLPASEIDAALLAAKNAVSYEPQTVPPEKQAQARANIGAVADSFFSFVEGDVITEYTSIMPEEAAFTKGKYCNPITGNITNNSNYRFTEDYIAVPAGARLLVHYKESTTKESYPIVIYYDADQNYIGGEYGFDLTQEDYEGKLCAFYNVPENTRYIRLSLHEKFFQYFNSISLYVVTEKRKGASVEIPGLVLPKSKIEGEHVVFFGDSVFGMYRDKTSVANRFAEMTGANVYNVGFGGCRMSVHPLTGYGEFSMWALADAIYNENWAAQDSAAASGASYFPDQLNILKAIDFGTVDRVVIHYGTNDFTGDAQLDNADNPMDYATVCGALRYSLEKLLAKYPHLRIYVSVPTFRYWANDAEIYPDTHTNSNGKTLLDFISAIAETAQEYGVPVIDGYHGLGVNKLNATTFIGDETHHNEAGRKRLGHYIASRICSAL